MIFEILVGIGAVASVCTLVLFVVLCSALVKQREAFKELIADILEIMEIRQTPADIPPKSEAKKTWEEAYLDDLARMRRTSGSLIDPEKKPT